MHHARRSTVPLALHSCHLNAMHDDRRDPSSCTSAVTRAAKGKCRLAAIPAMSTHRHLDPLDDLDHKLCSPTAH